MHASTVLSIVGGTVAVGLLSLSTSFVRAEAPAREVEPTVIERLVLLEQRVAQLETRLGVPADAPNRETPAAAAPAADPAAKLPAVVRSAIAKLHPQGQIIEVGRDAGDGYWWAEVRSEGRLFDVEITDAGEIRKNRQTRD